MRKPRAIVCDDDEVILQVFKHALESTGYEVLTAETPLTCAFFRDRAESCPQHDRCTDVLITDYAMPDMTGLELLEMQHHRGCKLTSRNKALLTGRDDEEIRRRAEVMGCSFFSKPLPISVLMDWIRECQRRTDLSEPLAKELFLPAKKKSLYVGR
jgi:CheY-like chemotaxis protein